ncbi:RNA polymerase sigma factor (sigma-70 family) [Arthrobacter woluwensis]|uniref:sigma-70 family RNA polymerase sigma factor n=1 Tax=Arthrobacter woluwensis TaxID=156980 RepID=UPI00278436E7|nr:sigma-70 family RNA polymerase sigma factor [Arthrobacter woluwensis]MDQ0707637.1 RNA polymerase sigma factor (sigma-70 family) [Arthrobacter woluwensis]
MSDDTQMSDGDLCLQVREGDQDAFGVLYERHAPLALSIARQSVDNYADAEDVVADSFHAVLDKLRSGDGPDTFFRAYLLQVVRRTAYARNRSAGRAIPTADEQQLDRLETPDDPTLMEFESQAAATAFRALPERWQEVIWYLDVEGQKPAAVAPIMGLAPNAVSALGVRARDALRREYLQAHVTGDVPEECKPYRDKLGGYVRGSLPRGAERKVREHLETCAKCTAIMVELGDVRATIKAVLLPLIIGAGPAAWWLTSAGQTAVLASLAGTTGGVGAGVLGGTAAAGAAGGAAGGGASGGAAGGGAAGGGAAGGALAGAGALGIGAAVAGIAVVAVGLVMAPSVLAAWQSPATQQSASQSQAAGPTGAQAPVAQPPVKPPVAKKSTATKSTEAKPAAPAPDPEPSPSDLPQLLTPLFPAPPALTPTPTPSATGSTSPSPSKSASAKPSATATPSSSVTPTGTATPTETSGPTTASTPTETTTTPVPTDSATMPVPTDSTTSTGPVSPDPTSTTSVGPQTPDPTTTPCVGIPWWQCPIFGTL